MTKFRLVLVAIFGVIGLIAILPASAEAPQVPELTIIHDEVHTDDIPSFSALRVGPQLSTSNAQSGDVVVYGDVIIQIQADMPDDVVAAVGEASLVWQNYLDLNGTQIVMELDWKSQGPSNLASAGPYQILVNGVKTPTSVVNANAGSDQFPGFADMQMIINSDRTWDTTIGPSNHPTNFHLQSVALHEIGHGLGFLSSVRFDSDGSQGPTAYDRHIFFDQSIQIHQQTNSFQTSDNLWFRYADSSHDKIYAPANFQQGSSISHYDEGAYPAGTSRSLMTPFFGPTEEVFTIDEEIQQVMVGIGWSLLDGGTTTPTTQPTTTTTPTTQPTTTTTPTTQPTTTTTQPQGWNGSLYDASTIDEIVNSYDYQVKLHGDILRLYRAYFNRPADVSGAQYWIKISEIRTLREITDYFAASDEFANDYAGTTNRQYLEKVYFNVLGRGYDQDGFDYWLDTLNGTNLTGNNPELAQLTRAGVVFYVAQGQEFLNNYPFTPDP